MDNFRKRKISQEILGYFSKNFRKLKENGEEIPKR